jgi:transcriptional regulator with XRE-family HTH domain
MKYSTNTLGVRVRMARESAGMSQLELARKLHYKSPSTIAKIESGENDLTQSKLSAFAAALDVPVGYLLGDALGIPVTMHSTNLNIYTTNKKASPKRQEILRLAEAMPEDKLPEAISYLTYLSQTASRAAKGA